MSAAPEGQIELLALALATGSTVRKWCADNGVPERTAYEWKSKASFKARVNEIRAELVDQAVGALSQSLARAIYTLIVLTADDRPDGIRLSSAKAVIDALIQVESFTKLSLRFTEMERRLAAIEAPRPIPLEEQPTP